MLLDIVSSQNTLDLSSALVALNTILMLIIGWLLREWWNDNKITRLKTDQNSQEIQLFKQAINSKVDMLEALVERDIEDLKDGQNEIKTCIDELRVEIRQGLNLLKK